MLSECGRTEFQPSELGDMYIRKHSKRLTEALFRERLSISTLLAALVSQHRLSQIGVSGT